MSMTLKFQLEIATRHDEQANVGMIGYCPKLSIYSQGRTENEAQGGSSRCSETVYRRELQAKVFGKISARSGDDGSHSRLRARKTAPVHTNRALRTPVGFSGLLIPERFEPSDFLPDRTCAERQPA